MGGKHHFDEKREASLLVLAADVFSFVFIFLFSTVKAAASLRTSD